MICIIKDDFHLQPVFDGRSNLYTRDPLPIGNEKMELEVSKVFLDILYSQNLLYLQNLIYEKVRKINV